MARTLVGGLIQCSNPVNDPEASVETVRNAMLEKHIPLIEEAGKKGVQVLCLQEIFNGPYFCPSQDSRWYDAAEAVPGPTVQKLSAYAKKYKMAMVIPVYEREMAGVYYNTAAVVDADGELPRASIGRITSRRRRGFWEKYFFKPGNLGYPTFQTEYARIGVYICYDRHFPEGARLLGPARRGDGVQPVRDGRRAQPSICGSWSSRPTRSPMATYVGAINRVGTEAPWNIGEFYGQSYFCDPRGQMLAVGSRDKDEVIAAEMDLDVIEEVRRTWQFYRRPPAGFLRGSGQAASLITMCLGSLPRAGGEPGGTWANRRLPRAK